MAALLRGSCKFFNADKGYGFLKRDDGQPDVFVHITDLQKGGLQDLNRDDPVEFDIEPGKAGKGPKAINVKLRG
jgi:CspA family cold shock protein